MEIFSFLNFSLSCVFNNFEVNNPERIESLTFKAVLAISIKGSTEINKSTNPTGSPNVDNTIKEAKVAPPPTPATPNELIIMD